MTPATIEARVNCNGAGNFVVYESNNGLGGNYMICINGYVFAACYVLVAGSGGIFSSLANVTSWVQGKVDDASDAGPQAKRDDSESLITWGQLYAALVTNSSTTATQSELATGGALKSFAKTASQTDEEAASVRVTALEIHEDGFSGTFSFPSNGTSADNSKRQEPDCWDQVHIHYWAPAGHDGTVLGGDQLHELAYVGIDHSYGQNYAAACYEMTNNGTWDGWLRVVFSFLIYIIRIPR
ncbi:hypothetical protein BR93DRAFT_925737 [Coniochaeta sp. PMI_546]|nr:hypothetical protein BR93DRAFT_925737 [Coniochaeta sp. PMI_546]